MVETSNAHVSEYLDSYIARKEPPKFAVLLKGKWGAGKTWFINDYFFRRREESNDDAQIDLSDGNKKNHIYISLYGLKDVAAINDELFAQVHPFLAKRGMKILTSLLKSTLKISGSFDIYGDSKPDASVTLGLPSTDLLNTAKKASKMVMVFDDLERCNIPINDVLGYINQFVEHEGAKVIILANQEEIEKRERHKGTADEKVSSQFLEYGRIKEKLIGREFELYPDVDSAIATFAKELSEPLRDRLRSFLPHIAELYTQSELDNLRRVRQALIDFDYWMSVLDSAYLEDADFFRHLLSLFCIYWMEVGTGNLNLDDLQMLPQWMFLGGFTKKNPDERDEKVINIARKYTSVDLTNAVFSIASWRLLISAGSISGETLNLEIRQCSFFRDKNPPSWKTFMHCREMRSDDFYTMLLFMEREFEKGNFNNIQEVKHVAGVFLTLTEECLYSRGPEWVVQTAKSALDILYRDGKVLPREIGKVEPFDRGSWGGYSFESREMNEFYVIEQHAEALVDIVTNTYLKTVAENLVASMESDLTSVTIQLTVGSNGRYGVYPILPLIDVNNFFAAWMRMNNYHRRFVGYMFDGRYEHLQVFPRAIEEVEWLKTLSKLIRTELNSQLTTYEKILVSRFDDQINKLIEKIENYFQV